MDGEREKGSLTVFLRFVPGVVSIPSSQVEFVEFVEFVNLYNKLIEGDGGATCMRKLEMRGGSCLWPAAKRGRAGIS